MSAWAAASRATIASAWRLRSRPASVSETARGPPGRSTSLRADELLEPGDLLADGRLRVAEAFRGPAEGALALDGLQRREMAQLDAQPFIRFSDHH